jgi:two-component system chemotaxis response regulator CheB
MSIATASLAPLQAAVPIRVMIVDDAVVVRGLIARWLSEEHGIEVVASHRTGRLAVDDMERADPDVVILDIEMPEMDGIEALPLILRKKRDCAVIMASTLTRRNAEISLKCLSLGALDYVPKPESNRELSTSLQFRRDLAEKVRQLGRKAISAARLARLSGRQGEATGRAGSAPWPRAEQAGLRPVPVAKPTATIRLRPFPATPPRLLLIGASTGGPQALQTVLAGLAPLIDRAPVLITQHMPAMFTAILAEHLGRACGKRSAEAAHGEPIRPGRVYVAPGGRHMLLRPAKGHGVIALDDGPAVNFCKPAVDPMLSSAAQLFGAAVQALILTGMGCDGAQGAGEVIAAGGCVIAQDEASSVVWGMPGAAAQAGHCSAVLPINEIAPKLLRLFAGDRP